VQNGVARGLRQVCPGRVRVDAEHVDDASDLRRRRDRATPTEGGHGAFAQRARVIRHHAPLVDGRTYAETVTYRAGTVGTVEREQPRLERGEGDSEFPADQTFATYERLAAVGRIDQQRAVTELERQLHRVRDPAFCAFFDDDAVHHHVQVVGFQRIERQLVREIHVLTVQASTHEAVASQPFQLGYEIALFATRDG
jgi:hypothetical protein